MVVTMGLFLKFNLSSLPKDGSFYLSSLKVILEILFLYYLIKKIVDAQRLPITIHVFSFYRAAYNSIIASPITKGQKRITASTIY